jgi:hypothetical protein
MSGHGEEIEGGERSLVAHESGEGRDHFRIGEVLLLRRHRHHQVVGDEPCDQVRVGRPHVVVLAEAHGVARAQVGMVPAASLGDVVEEGGEIQDLDVVELLHELRAERVFVVELREPEAPQVPDDHEDVLVHGVDVEEVVLHLPDDAPEGGKVAAEHAVATHAAKRPGESFGAQDRHEAAAVVAPLAKRLVDLRQRSRQGTQRPRPEARHLGVLLEPQERFEDLAGLALEEALVADLEVAVHDLEVVVQYQHLPRGIGRDVVEEVAEQDLVEAPDRLGREVVAAHQQVRGRHGAARLELQLPGDVDLVVEDEPILARPAR